MGGTNVARGILHLHGRHTGLGMAYLSRRLSLMSNQQPDSTFLGLAAGSLLVADCRAAERIKQQETEPKS